MGRTPDFRPFFVLCDEDNAGASSMKIQGWTMFLFCGGYFLPAAAGVFFWLFTFAQRLC